MLVYAVKEVKIAELPFSKRLLFSRSLSANVIIAELSLSLFINIFITSDKIGHFSSTTSARP